MMKSGKMVLGVLLTMALAVPAAAQDDELERARQVERERMAAEREAERQVVDIDVQMREAESRLAEAARRVAELSTRRLSPMASATWSAEFSDKPALGITIGSRDEKGDPVAGVEILGVSPGGAAGEAGLRSGDVITAINGEMLSADSSQAANEKLLDFMGGVEEGDTLDVEYLRDGKSASVEVAPRSMAGQVFAFGAPGSDFSFSIPRVAPSDRTASVNRYVFVNGDSGWGDLEMVSLTEDLGRYFGADAGLLVVRAPKDDRYKLRDGDIILNIDGREPSSVSHAIRILGSYQEGENLEIRIMRDKRPQTLEIEMPDHRRGAVYESIAPHVRSSITVAPDVNVVVEDDSI